jgi:hypothetical protein
MPPQPIVIVRPTGGQMQPDSDKDPAVVLPYLLGRKLGMEEIYEAFDLKKSTYYNQLEKGTLTTADRLISVARQFDINPVNLLVLYNHLDMRDIMEAAVGAAEAAEEAVELGKSLPRGRRGVLSHLRDLDWARQPHVNPL